jgi:hypothetical protein
MTVVTPPVPAESTPHAADAAAATAPRRVASPLWRLWRVSRWVLGAVVLLVVLLPAGLAWALPSWLKPRLEAQGQAWLGTPVVIQGLAVRPLALEVELTGLRIGTPQAPLLTLGGLLVDVSGDSLWRLTPIVSRLSVREPQLHVSRAAAVAGAASDAAGLDGYNFSPVLEHLRARLAALPPKPAEPGGEQPLPHFELHQLHLSGGRFDYDDERLAQHHHIEQLDLALPLISSLPADVTRPVVPRLSARIDGSVFELDAQARPFAPGRPAELALQWQGYPLAPWADLLRAVLPPALRPVDLSGSLDLKLALSFNAAPAVSSGAPAGAAPGMQLSLRGELALNGFHVALPGQGAEIGFKALKLEALDLAPLDQRFAARRLLFDTLDLRYTHKPPAPTPGAQVAAAARPASASAAAAAGSGAVAASPAAAPGLKPTLSLAEFACRACRIAVTDAQAVPPVQFVLAPLDLSVKDITADFSQPLAVLLDTGIAAAGKAQAPGHLKVDGRLSLQDLAGAPAVLGQPGGRLAVAATLDLAGLDLRLAQSYLAPLFNIELQAGRFGTAGDLKLLLALDGAAPSGRVAAALPAASSGASATAAAASTPATLASAGLPRVTYRGRLAVDGLRSFIGRAGDELLAWRKLGLDGLDLAWQPGQLQAGLGHITLDGLRGRVIVLPGGTLNLADIVKRDPAAVAAAATAASAASAPASRTVAAASPASAPGVAAPASAPGHAPVLSWQQIQLSDGAVYFTDRNIRPGFSAYLSKLTGSISAVSSQRPEPAKVELNGAVDGVAPLRIAGRVHPLGVRAFTDIDASARGIPLSRLSGYAERYAGYAIDKGSLSVALHYKIEDGKLEADNQLFLDQLTFGKASDSAEATKLPVRLAVALLSNRRGEIDIRLPVAGTLDDPQFSIGGVIWRVLVNLVGKALSAPFSLLMGDGDGEQGQVDFAPGSSELDDAGRRRLDALADKLLDRPALKLEATGQADPARDGAELQRRAQAAPPPPASAATDAALMPPGAASSVAAAPVAPSPADLQAALRELADRRADHVLAYLGVRLPIERVGLVRSQVGDAAAAADPALAPGVQLRLF